MVLDRLRMLRLAAAAPWPLMGAAAQSAAPGAPAASSASAELTPAERAKRDGDKVFHWILIHGDKPRKAAASRDDKPMARVKPTLRAPAHLGEPATTAPVVTEAAAGPAPAASAPEPAAEAPVESVQAKATPATAPPEEAVSGALAPARASAAEPDVAVVAAPPADEHATEPLTPLAQPEPRFPANLLRTLRSGQVQVRFTVLPDGSVAEPVVMASSNPKLNPSALAAVAQWRFAPVHKPQQGFVDLGFNSAE